MRRQIHTTYDNLLHIAFSAKQATLLPLSLENIAVLRHAVHLHEVSMPECIQLGSSLA